MIPTTLGFRLSTYLRDISCTLKLTSDEVVPLDCIAYTEECLFQSGVMVHDFWAGGVTAMPRILDGVGKLRLDYHISFTGHPYEEPNFIELAVPLLRRECLPPGATRRRARGRR